MKKSNFNDIMDELKEITDDEKILRLQKENRNLKSTLNNILLIVKEENKYNSEDLFLNRSFLQV